MDKQFGPASLAPFQSERYGEESRTAPESLKYRQSHRRKSVAYYGNTKRGADEDPRSTRTDVPTSRHSGIEFSNTKWKLELDLKTNDADEDWYVVGKSPTDIKPSKSKAADEAVDLKTEADSGLNHEAYHRTLMSLTGKGSTPLDKGGGTVTNSVLDPIKQQTQSNEVERFGKLLRQVSKMIDDVLFGRTQWRHAYQKLEHSRQYLETSRANLMSATAFHYSGNIPSQRDTQESNVTDGVPHLRSALHDLHSPSRSDQQYQSSSPRADSGVASGEHGSQEDIRAYPTPSFDVQELYRQHYKDYEAVVAQEKLVKELMDELSNLEFRLAQKQEAISKYMHAKNFVDELRTEMLEMSLAQSDSDSQPHSISDDVPPLVAEYFERRGDFGIFQERLQELIFNHEEGKLERDFLRERGDDHLVEVPDEEFEVNFLTRRKKIQEDLEWAHEEAARLEKMCEQQGLDINAHRTNPHRASAASLLSTSAVAQSAQLMSDTLPPLPLEIEMRPPGLLPHSNVTINSSRRIDTWLQDVQADVIGFSDNLSAIHPSTPASEYSLPGAERTDR